MEPSEFTPEAMSELFGGVWRWDTADPSLPSYITDGVIYILKDQWYLAVSSAGIGRSSDSPQSAIRSLIYNLTNEVDELEDQMKELTRMKEEFDTMKAELNHLSKFEGV